MSKKKETKIHDNDKVKERLKTQGRRAWKMDVMEERVAVLEREINKLPSGTGLLHTPGEWNGITFHRAPDEQVYPSEIAAAQIVFGTDRPDSFRSGYGGEGSNRAASIDLVVGRMAGAQDGEGPKDCSGTEALLHIRL